MLKVEHLVKRYKGNDFDSVQDISFEVKKGEIFGFLGNNGAGKSTCIKCITGLIPFDSGKVEIVGADIMKNPIAAKRNLGYVPDNHMVLDKLTGREYVNYIADLYQVGLLERKEKISYFTGIFRLEKAIDKQIKAYSHGMKQKICIMAALIHNPMLWVLDEPMLGLDPLSTAEILLYMQEHAKKGNAVFFSSHNLDIVKNICHRVGIVSGGQLKEVIELAGNEENKNRLEERFFTLTAGRQSRVITPTEPLPSKEEV